MSLSGPIFEPEESRYWKSIHGKHGAHYNIFAIGPGHRVQEDEEWLSMEAFHDFFKDGKADELNFCLFSTSGVHGMYTTIEEVEAWIRAGSPPYDEENYDALFADAVTFLIMQPRTVTLRYGNVYPKTQADIEFLKRVRQSSWDVMASIGRNEEKAAPLDSPPRMP